MTSAVAKSPPPSPGAAEEEARLLLGSPSSLHLRRGVSYATLAADGVADVPTARAALLHEAGRLMALALPLVLTSLSSFLVSMIGLAFVGRLGTTELSIAILATSLFNVTGLSFLLGSLGALETLAAQAYGAKAYPAVGVALQRALLFTSVLAAGVAAIWIKAESLLLLLGQDPALAAGAARYLIWSIPALAFVALGECLKRYLTAQEVVAPAAVAAGAALVAAPACNWLLVVKAQWGLFGAAMAGNAAQLAPFFVVLIWTVLRERRLRATAAPERTWHGWSREALREWGAYLKLAGPSAAMVCLEWSTFEACVILSGLLPSPETSVAVMGLTLNVSGLLYMLPMGLGSATSVRVGNALGAGLPRAAARAAHVAAAIALFQQMCLAGITLGVKDIAAFIFTDDVGVAAAAAAIFPIMAVCLLGDGINAAVAGVLRGAGRQELGAVFNLVAYWFVGLPLAAILAFKVKMGVSGLWTGLAACACINGVAMTMALLRLNWRREAMRATGREVEFIEMQRNSSSSNNAGEDAA